MNDSIYELTAGRHGRFLVNPRDQYVGKSLLAYGEWGAGEVRLLTRLVRPGNTVIEVGANIGSHTVALARASGDSGAVYAFEPQRLVHQLLCANLALNGCLNVHARQAAVSDAAGFVEICNIPPHHEMNFGCISVGHDFGGDTVMEQVPLVSIDSMVLTRLDVLKLDAEGHEPKVLRGAVDTLKAYRPIIFTEINPKTLNALADFFSDMEYDCWWFCTRVYEKDNFLGNEENIWSYHGYDVCNADVLALPRGEGWVIEGLSKLNVDVNWSALPLQESNFREGLNISRYGVIY